MHQLVHPGFNGEMPYNLALVDLDEGVRVIANVVGIADDELAIGQRVAVIFDQITEDVALPRFRLESAG